MIRILLAYAHTLGLCFLMTLSFFYQLRSNTLAMPDQTFFGSSWKLHHNQMVRVAQDSLYEISSTEIERIKHEIIFNPSVLLENKANPVGMLTECCAEFNYCRLNRRLDISHARKRFEEKVVSELETQLNREGGQITLVDVGSGGLFQDLLLITKLFEINIHPITLNCVFIDTEYRDYIKIRNNIKDNQKMEEFYSGGNDIQVMDFYPIYNAEVHLQKIHARLVQLFQWVEQTYPQHTLNMFVYDSVDAYVADLIQKPYLRANIYMGVDLDKNYRIVEYLERAEDDNSEFKNGNEAYLSGPLDKILKPHGVGLMLTKECFDGKKYIFNEGYIFRNHCIKILSADAARPDDAHLINPNRPTLYGRYVVLAETYNLPSLPVRLWRWLFGKQESRSCC